MLKAAGTEDVWDAGAAGATLVVDEEEEGLAGPVGDEEIASGAVTVFFF
jgi:hypothetical protein